MIILYSNSDVFLGILAFLGDIKLWNIEGKLFNNEMTHKFPINLKKYKKNSIAVFTEKWTPEEREEQFGVLFQGQTLKSDSNTSSIIEELANNTTDIGKLSTLTSICTSLGYC